ncbi:hypothetical protein H4F38_10410 [Pectobacterium brasiliense]|uniref:hypothetical protein n=1 Tax=Pectobacterium brasiliense TaxID=180957 RepID=UPI00094A38A0|nr:hypothetical protein [Pectobacterium brasiliense]APS29998.1 hypothetical protein NC16_09820 [Pectobacterium brasiliense]MBN3098166.1 hypothetical protein [Pectobacterium brasiliense]MBN3102908.1 hypothetical protein [Pectobacterium brasiliense]MBN3164754.1 hypothetical protein [Pectobacterium brasiliense]
MNNITIVFCEGGHDIAFLTRLLLWSGFEDYDKKVEKFHTPFNNLFSNELKKIDFSERKLGYVGASHRIPSAAFHKTNNLVFIHNLNGDGKERERKEVLELYKKIRGPDPFSKNFDFTYKFLYFFDADQIGVNIRLQQISQEIGLSSPLVNGELRTHDDDIYGSYIYHDAGNGLTTGVLEDVIFDLVKGGNANVFTAASSYLQSHQLPTQRCCELKIRNGQEVYGTANKFKIKKSIISIMGQLQFSGSSNIVVIKNSDFFKSADIAVSQVCNDIVSMF